MFHLDDGTWVTWDENLNATSLTLVGQLYVVILNDQQDPEIVKLMKEEFGR